MSVLSQGVVEAACRALIQLTDAQRSAVTTAWFYPARSGERTASVEPKLARLASAVLDYHSHATFAELEAMRAVQDPLVLEVRAELERAKHEIGALHHHIALLNAQNYALRRSMNEATHTAREVNTDFAVMRGTLNTQF